MVVIKNDVISLMDNIALGKLRCPLCKHLPDYEIISISPKQARIIYRNFKDSDEYFEDVKGYLKSNGFECVKEVEHD